MDSDSFFLVLGMLTFAAGMFFFTMFFWYRLIEEHWPEFIFGFTKEKRLERKRRRLKKRLSFINESAQVYEEIARLEAKLADAAINKPRGFLND